jgi:DNA-binding winged helix-turn-helix (wHTH) protein/TolB-like protein
MALSLATRRRGATKSGEGQTKSGESRAAIDILSEEKSRITLRLRRAAMPATVCLNGFRVDLDRAELRAPDGRVVAMRAQSMAVLVELARRHGELVTKQELFARVWPGVSVTDDSLVQCVVEIRRALGDTRQELVRTLPRRGYTLVRTTPADAAAAVDSMQPPADRPKRRPRALLLVACAALGAVVLVAAGLSLGLRHASTAPMAPTQHVLGANLAVLPLRATPWAGNDGNAAGEPAPDGEGLAWMIAGELARNPEMRVASSIVTAALARDGANAWAIGRQLGVEYVIDGTVARREGRLRLAAQLIDTRNDAIVWTWQFEPTAEQINQATDELVVRVGRSIGASVRELRKAGVLSGAPASLDVYGRVLRGIALKHRLTPDSLRRSRLELEEATRLDPRYGPAWLYLGWVKAIAITNRSDPTLGPGDLPQALGEVRRAIELDPAMPAGWQGLAVVLVHSGRYGEAVSAAERAVSAGPGDPDNWLFLGWALEHAGRPIEGLAHVDKALSWNPMRPAYYPAIHARVAYAAGRYDDARGSAYECMARAPAVGACKALWLSSLMRLGRAAEAHAAWPGMLGATPALRDLRVDLRAADNDLAALRQSSGEAR